MPRMLNSQALRSGRWKIVACSGTRSPTFQPKRFARSAPTIAPFAIGQPRLHLVVGQVNSGYIRIQLSASTAMFGNWFCVSW